MAIRESRVNVRLSDDEAAAIDRYRAMLEARSGSKMSRAEALRHAWRCLRSGLLTAAEARAMGVVDEAS